MRAYSNKRTTANCARESVLDLYTGRDPAPIHKRRVSFHRALAAVHGDDLELALVDQLDLKVARTSMRYPPRHLRMARVHARKDAALRHAAFVFPPSVKELGMPNGFDPCECHLHRPIDIISVQVSYAKE